MQRSLQRSLQRPLERPLHQLTSQVRSDPALLHPIGTHGLGEPQPEVAPFCRANELRPKLRLTNHCMLVESLEARVPPPPATPPPPLTPSKTRRKCQPPACGACVDAADALPAAARGTERQRAPAQEVARTGVLGRSGRVYTATEVDKYIEEQDYATTEEEIFDALRLPYRPPTDRCA